MFPISAFIDKAEINNLEFEAFSACLMGVPLTDFLEAELDKDWKYSQGATGILPNHFS